MKDLDFIFEQTPWEAALANLHPGDKLPALRFLALLEGESDSAAEEALEELEEKRVALDISGLPKDPGTGAAAERLWLEEKLSRENRLPAGLEENDPLRIYLEEVAATPVLLIEPEALAQRCLQGDEQAMSALAGCYLSRVINLAREYTGRGVLLLDLIQEGSLSLWQGIRRYQGGAFAPWADWWIRQYMAKAVTMQARQSGVGQKMRRSLEAFQAADKQLLTRLGRNPTLEEIAQQMDVSPEEASILEDALQNARVMAKVRQPEAQPTQEDAQPVENTAYFQSRQRIEELLSTLEQTDAELLRLRFGVESGKAMSAQQVSVKLGIPEQEVLNREAAALEKLRGRT